MERSLRKPACFRLLVAGGIFLGGMVHAQQVMAVYYAELGYEDYFNSRGVPLTDASAVLQQDRANYHRFGIRHGGDETDPFFGNQGTRAAIPNLFLAGPNGGYVQSALSGGWPGYATSWLVQVCGNGRIIQYLVVDPADGDGYSDC